MENYFEFYFKMWNLCFIAKYLLTTYNICKIGVILDKLLKISVAIATM